jgi:hypothetical protein
MVFIFLFIFETTAWICVIVLCFQPSSNMVTHVWGMTNIKEGLGVCYSYINIFIKTYCSQ